MTTVTLTARGTRERLRAWALTRLDGHCERAVAERKRALMGGLHGRILEIGPGPGVNLGYYPPDIDWLGIESNLSCYPAIRAEADRRGMRVELRIASAIGLGECQPNPSTRLARSAVPPESRTNRKIPRPGCKVRYR